MLRIVLLVQRDTANWRTLKNFQYVVNCMVRLEEAVQREGNEVSRRLFLLKKWLHLQSHIHPWNQIISMKFFFAYNFKYNLAQLVYKFKEIGKMKKRR